MIVYEAKLKGTLTQYRLLDEAIRTGQFIRNKALRYWMDNQKVKRSDLLKLCTELRRQFSLCRKLSAQACQSSIDRAWAAISRCQKNCRLQVSGKKSYPKFKKNSRSIEYKSDGWKLSDNKRQITFRDGFMTGEFQLIGTRDLHFYQKEQIKRVRVIRRTDGYYCQFCIDYNRVENHVWTGRTVGIYKGIECFYTDSDGNTVEFPDSLSKTYKAFKRAQRKLHRKVGFSRNRDNAKRKLGRTHLKLSRRRRDWACKTAQALVKSADLIVYEDTKANFSTSEPKLTKSIYEKEWREFICWVEYFAKIHGILVVAISSESKKRESSKQQAKSEKEQNNNIRDINENQNRLCRDRQAAKIILAEGLSLLGEKRQEIVKLLNTVGRTEIKACGDRTTNIIEEIQDVKLDRRTRKS